MTGEIEDLRLVPREWKVGRQPICSVQQGSSLLSATKGHVVAECACEL